MTQKQIVIAAMGLLMVAFVTREAVSQNAKEAPKDASKDKAPVGMPQMNEQEAAMMQEYMKIASPSEHHKRLEPFVGKWSSVTKMYMGGPGSPAMESTGTTERKWVLSGRFLMDEHKGQMMGMPHEGIGFTGYDNFRNMYVGNWMDNMGTHLLTFTGMADPTGKVFTYYGDMDEASMKVVGRTVKYVTKIIDNDKHTFELYDLHAGENYKVVEVTYTRVK